ncbi:MAG: hypothetical protein ACFFAK_18640 [Promethearchaeota archaeon]
MHRPIWFRCGAPRPAVPAVACASAGGALYPWQRLPGSHWCTFHIESRQLFSARSALRSFSVAMVGG